MIVKGVRAYFYVCQEWVSQSVQIGRCVAVVLGVVYFCIALTLASCALYIKL